MTAGSDARRESNRHSVVAAQTLDFRTPVGKNTGVFKLHLQAKATLGTSAEVRAGVKLPPRTDRDSWIAAQLLILFENAQFMAAMLSSEEVNCNDESCPLMGAGDYVNYYWSDETSRHPVELSAPDYIQKLLDYTFSKLHDQAVVPTDGSPFPADFEKTASKLVKRIYRIYAHAYMSHFEEFRENEVEAELNSFFKHLLCFAEEFDLMQDKDFSPLEQLIRTFKDQR
jgi:MOB kinase activator 1